MYDTSSQINLIDLHDSPVKAIVVTDVGIRLDLAFACMSRGHSCNPYGKAQTIAPCLLVFHGVSDQLTQVFCDTERVFKPHTDGSMPIDGDIMEFKTENIDQRIAVFISGFYQSDWVEWRFTCSSAQIFWTDFVGPAWYESE
jgi:hypothetical protein